MILIYVTFETNDNARAVAKDLIEERLVSCANIFPPIQSIYKWDGQMQEESEIVVIFKTHAELFEQVEKRIKSLHSYETPCIVALPVEKSSKEFVGWVSSSIYKISES